MDLALARQSGQELHNDYVITDGAEFGHLKRFFRAAVRALVRAFIAYPLPGNREQVSPMACSPIKPQTVDKTTDTEHDASVDRPEGIPVMSLPPPLIFTMSTPVAPAVPRSFRRLTPNNASLQFVQSSPGDDVSVS